MEINKEKLIAKYAAPDDVSYSGRKKVGKIKCAGCGEWIQSDYPLGNVEVSLTKRGTLVVFHSDCAAKIWKSKIK